MDTKQLQADLEAELITLDDQLTRLRDNDPATNDFRDDDNVAEDDAIESEEGFRVLSLINQLTNRKEAIERTIAKIKDGSYGICELCGNPISEKRLKAVRTSVLCISCKTREEEKSKVD